MIFEITVAAGTIFALDQLTKAAIVRHLPQDECWTLGAHLKIRHLQNRSIPQLFFTRLGMMIAWVLMMIGALFLARDGYFFRSAGARLALGVAVGGTAGNLWDRLRRGGVIDFVDLSWWPVFNFADLAITVGVALALYFAARP